MLERRRFYTDCKIISNFGKPVQTHPTIGSNYEEVTYKNISLQAWDVGGQESLRKMWDVYCKGAHVT